MDRVLESEALKELKEKNRDCYSCDVARKRTGWIGASLGAIKMVTSKQRHLRWDDQLIPLLKEITPDVYGIYID